MKTMNEAKDVKKTSLALIRECFFEQELLSLNDIREKTSLSHGAVVSGVKKLEEDKEIVLSAKSGSSVGRKTHLYSLNPDSFTGAMIFIGRNEKTSTIRYHTALCDLSGVFHEERIIESDTYDLKDLKSVIDETVESNPKIDMVLISSPGVCMDGVIRNKPYFEADAASLIKAHSLLWAVENDVNTACIGFHSEQKGIDDLAFVYQAKADVFGCGMMIHGALYNGFAHAAGELRYFPFMRYAKEKTAEELLKEQILSVAALMNPECIAYYSENVKDDIDLSGQMPGEVLPAIVRADDFYALQKKGLYAVMKQHVLTKRGSLK